MTATNILIIDDDPLLCDMLAQMLELEGFGVTVAGNGSIGLEALKQGKFGLILLDLVMPKMDGIRFLRLLPGHVAALPPILIMSASVSGEITDSVRGLGVVGIARKPVHPEPLMEKIRAALASQPQIGS